MLERCEIGWISVYSVRALCLYHHGYDPEMENFDQTPYYKNQGGGRQMCLQPQSRGAVCPLIEGHSDTRDRFTCNFTCFSDKERIRKGEYPYCEFMFRADGEQLLLRFREYIRSRGFGPWVSVATSPKGSYRLPDILNFLERHLPPMTESRQWRILRADDFPPT